ncbi:2-oxoglutarate dehydrogenase complex dihydrolipoyllysine-residue succinyltransferase [Pseudogemmatithrix spongiicola]|uniref:Dihydrolipoyllysine-residue succinyltransferase component of 2-oxoglutarate dehydrogenase complex n=1 Tax=Pseudogemmatithrix spongiicola TaxID=3062599 RepID=A0AA49Q3M0_9BACT|nr:2-oxoglutarate dehydrogenase complex dihydrolipoyllysine-residue succinyltransferase [Gemmatimonadaceae bacterium 'strain 138']WKW13931.1 2-oxoglutarate dehydrogenase complex dihydrolipoyllysine-residue succinyltransferase [Gemmatimonadaceae bacterium 'strain 318']
MIEIKVPPLGESITEATVSRWLKQEGEAIAVGDTLVELETDKITVEVPALNAGVLRKRLKNEGDVVQLAETLGHLEEGASAGAAPAAAAPAPSAPAAPAPGAPSAPAAPAAPAAPVAAPSTGDLRAAPSAQKLAAATGVDLSTVQGSGRGGVISKPDVVAASAAPAPTKANVPAPAPTTAPVKAAPAPAPRPEGTRETREKMTTRRKRIAENLLQAQHATAHLTTFNEIDMSAVSAVRERMKERVEKEHGVKLSFMPFFAKAACMALKAYPVVNAQIDGDSVIYKHYVNLGIAVASEQGLVVPNVKDADRMGMVGFSRAMNAVAKRARDGKLTMDDLTGGTFTITNGGVFGSLVSTPIINYPQVAILGLHKIQERPVAIDGKVEIRPMMYVALSYDHRIIDGQQAVLFLVRVKELMEDPAAMLIDD